MLSHTLTLSSLSSLPQLKLGPRMYKVCGLSPLASRLSPLASRLSPHSLTLSPHALACTTSHKADKVVFEHDPDFQIEAMEVRPQDAPTRPPALFTALAAHVRFMLRY